MKYAYLKYDKEAVKKFYDRATQKVGLCYDGTAVASICEADMKESVRRAFRDLTVRTMKRKNADSIVLDDLAKNCCDQGLYASLDEWINQKTTEDFDVWHKKLCDKIILFLQEYYVEDDCTYGKAQKIVNMTFKNLYAICVKKGIEDVYADRFQKCHVPLDSFTLEWFCRECENQNHKITKERIANWSAIEAYGDGETFEYTAKDNKRYYTYFCFQQIFRNWYRDSDMTPLQAEFMVWPEIQVELAAEGFLLALKENPSEADKKEIHAKTLPAKKEEIRERLNQ